MDTPQHEQGAAIAFQVTEDGILEDIDRYRRGRPWRAIPTSYTTRQAVRRALLQLGPSLIQEGIDAAHVSDRRQWKATGSMTRKTAYLVRDGLYISQDRRRTPTLAG